MFRVRWRNGSGISPEAVRSYERVGVRSARDGQRPATGTTTRRRWTGSASSGPRSAVGLTLGQVREVIAFRDQGEPRCSLVLDLIRRQSAELGAGIAEMTRIESELDHLTERARSLRPEVCAEGPFPTSSQRVRPPAAPERLATVSAEALNVSGRWP